MWSRGHQGTRRRNERRRGGAVTSLEGEEGREAHIKGGNSWELYGGNKFSVGSLRPTYLLVSVRCKFLFEVGVKVATT